jgi:protease-4
LKDALDDDDVKAVVLRVDSPGGSAFASEIIRDGVLALKKAGKPVVVSMGSLAASGGYWVSASADEIYAAPTTITGSIGIFGLFTTFENTAAELGVFTDGVGTTALSPILNTGIGPLPANAADLFQKSTEDGYERFLSVVSEGRKLDRNYVDSIAQGRVWIGQKALELKLVDKLGGLDDATAAAAKRAGLEKYDVVNMVEEPTPFERIFGEVSTQAMKVAGFESKSALSARSTIAKMIASAEAQIEFFDGFNDPNGLYARCLACEL